ncbi:aldehyde dehydrogenase EutE [Clostridium malenominatum]|uniref:Aldehyde dehydrogenase EutE n=1 Tax=Clostridium malenominatum TaxID=1539 RepID=A0ABN1ITR1_9CLOT
MGMNKNNIEKIVQLVIAELKNKSETEVENKMELGIFEEVDDAIEAAVIAQKELVKLSLENREKLLKAMREEITKNIEMLSRMAFEETGMGRYEDKIKKNTLVVEKTPGTEDLKSEAYSGDNGLTLIELSPFGVIGAITPSTNPTETTICNAIGMVAAGNSVVFAPHPSAKNVTIKTIEILNTAIINAGGPKNLLTTIKKPTIESVNKMMTHPKINLISATGGPGVVKAALSSGKKAIGAGAGNPPVVVDETADIEKAAKDIIDGSSFDNNLPCIAEKEVIVVDSVADYLIFNMKKHGVYEIKDNELIKKLEKLLLIDGKTPNKDYVGKNADYILSKIGVEVDSSIRAIIAEVEEDHPFVLEELMMPILPIVRVKNIDEGIELAVKVENGNRHTAIMHSKNVDNLTRCAKALQTTIFVKNAPSFAGIGFGGEGYTTFTIAGPTGEGLTSARSFTRKRRCVLAEGLSIR